MKKRTENEIEIEQVKEKLENLRILPNQTNHFTNGFES